MSEEEQKRKRRYKHWKKFVPKRPQCGNPKSGLTPDFASLAASGHVNVDILPPSVRSKCKRPPSASTFRIFRSFCNRALAREKGRSDVTFPDVDLSFTHFRRAAATRPTNEQKMGDAGSTTDLESRGLLTTAAPCIETRPHS